MGAASRGCLARGRKTFGRRQRTVAVAVAAVATAIAAVAVAVAVAITALLLLLAILPMVLVLLAPSLARLSLSVVFILHRALLKQLLDVDVRHYRRHAMGVAGRGCGRLGFAVDGATLLGG